MPYSNERKTRHYWNKASYQTFNLLVGCSGKIEIRWLFSICTHVCFNYSAWSYSFAFVFQYRQDVSDLNCHTKKLFYLLLHKIAYKMFDGAVSVEPLWCSSLLPTCSHSVLPEDGKCVRVCVRAHPQLKSLSRLVVWSTADPWQSH